MSIGRDRMMTLEEIQQQFPQEWVLIEFTELDEDLKVVDGQVIAHSPSKENIYKKLLEVKSENIAIEFTGEMPKEPAYWL
jgi:hypothetical protein